MGGGDGGDPAALAGSTWCSNLMHQVVWSVVGDICAHLTPRSLQLILAVLNPETNEDEDDNVLVTDDTEEQLKCRGDEDSDSEDNKNSESDVDSEDGEEREEEDRDKDPGFRQAAEEEVPMRLPDRGTRPVRGAGDPAA